MNKEKKYLIEMNSQRRKMNNAFFKAMSYKSKLNSMDLSVEDNKQLEEITYNIKKNIERFNKLLDKES